MSEARQGEVWFVDLEPTLGREQPGRRPAVVVSVDELGTGPSDMAIVVPLTTRASENPIRVQIDPPEGGVREPSWAMPEMVRSIDRGRLVECWGSLDPSSLGAITARVRLLVRSP